MNMYVMSMSVMCDVSIIGIESGFKRHAIGCNARPLAGITLHLFSWWLRLRRSVVQIFASLLHFTCAINTNNNNKFGSCLVKRLRACLPSASLGKEAQYSCSSSSGKLSGALKGTSSEASYYIVKRDCDFVSSEILYCKKCMQCEAKSPLWLCACPRRVSHLVKLAL